MAHRHSVALPLWAFLRPLALTLTLIPIWAGAALAARHALLIGVSDYAHSGFTDLPGAQRDLVLVEEALRSRLGFAPGEIRVLRNAEATHTGITRAFADLAQAAGRAIGSSSTTRVTDRWSPISTTTRTRARTRPWCPSPPGASRAKGSTASISWTTS